MKAQKMTHLIKGCLPSLIAALLVVATMASEASCPSTALTPPSRCGSIYETMESGTNATNCQNYYETILTCPPKCQSESKPGQCSCPEIATYFECEGGSGPDCQTSHMTCEP